MRPEQGPVIGIVDTSAARPPAVSIGLPVYNGQRYLAEAIESLLGQTFVDFELILCDNASTDRTEAICRGFAARDSRVRYHRNERNLGACPNFNLAFELSRGRYFKWAAHDDRCAPTYLERCVEAMERDPSLVLCHARPTILNERGEAVRCSADGARVDESLVDPPNRCGSLHPSERLRDVLVRTRWCFEMFGVVRSDALRRTPLLRSFYGSDKVLLAALALQGRFGEIEEPLFRRRHHPMQSSEKRPGEQAKWIDSRSRGAFGVRPQVRCGLWYLKLIARSPLTLAERLRCVGETVRWSAWLTGLLFRQRRERGFLHRIFYKRLERFARSAAAATPVH